MNNQHSIIKPRPCTIKTKISTRREVSFALDENDQSAFAAPLIKCLTEEHCKELWYQAEELYRFKMSVRQLMRNSPETFSDDDLCGLERFTAERTTYKKSAIYYTLCAQRRKLCPDKIRQVSERCTAWARALAEDQAFKDYCEAYDPLGNLVDILEETDFEMPIENIFDCKRKLTDDEPLSLCGTDRMVRQRTMPNQVLLST